jgi:hypothetical protein
MTIHNQHNINQRMKLFHAETESCTTAATRPANSYNDVMPEHARKLFEPLASFSEKKSVVSDSCPATPDPVEKTNGPCNLNDKFMPEHARKLFAGLANF